MNITPMWEAIEIGIKKKENDEGLRKGSIWQTIEKAKKAGWKMKPKTPPKKIQIDGLTAFMFSSQDFVEEILNKYEDAKYYLISRKS